MDYIVEGGFDGQQGKKRAQVRDLFNVQDFYFIFVTQQPTTATGGQRRPMKAHSSQCRPTKSHGSQPRPTTAHSSQRRPTKAHGSQRRPTTAHKSPRQPMKANDGPQQPTQANDGPHQPTQAHESPQQPTQANAGPRKPTAANEGQRQPTAANAGPRRPTAANDGQRRPTQAHEDKKGPNDARWRRLGPRYVFFFIFFILFLLLRDSGHPTRTRTPRNPYPGTQVRVFWGTGTGSPGKPQGYPCQSLEVTEYRDWWKADSKACTIVEQWITPVTLALLPQGVVVTAREVWETLKTLYSRRDVMSQFELRDRLSNAKLKDHRDLERYIGEFKTGRLRFIEMGIPYSEYDMVHSIIRGLPDTGSWAHFSMLVTQNTQDFIDAQSHAVVQAAPDTLLDRIISRLVVECQRIEASKPAGKSGPNSEYCNHAGGSGDVIHKHEKNPDGILCSNCGKKSHDAP